MPLRLEIKRKLSARSERVKCNDFHPTEPWILAALYSGHVFIWNYTTQTMVKSIEVCDLPVRTAKFIPAKQWIICGSDDMQIRIYNYNTMERVRTFEAHTDYIRSLAIHPTLPYVLSSSDDMLIKLWDWDKGWECLQVFEGHTHYVMQVEFNPKDTNTFASASLDRTVKVWGLNSPNPHFSLEGHERGVNCIGYFRGGDRPYLVSGADDHLIKIWDYQTKSCVATLDGHTNNVSAVCFHPQLPIILSGSEDGTVRIWHSNTYRLENTLNYGMERVWTISCLKGSNKVAIGYDDGTIMIKLGHEEPVVSMERGGKVVWAKNHEIVIANIRSAGEEVQDGERVQVQTKDLGSCEIYPQSLSHDPKGRLLCVCGDGEYIVYTALALRNKSFGPALEFVWANDSGSYATRESSSKIKIFKDFKEHKQFRPTFAAEGIFGGALLGIRSNDFIDLYDWSECRVIRRIDVCPRKVFWSESGDVIILACDSSFYVLRYNRDLVNKYFDQGVEIGEQGIEGAFDLEQEVAEKVRNGHFVGDCFIYTNTAGRLNYYVGGEVMTLAHLGKAMYLLGYLPKENRVYLMDKAHNIYTYSLLVSVLVYQTAIVRRDLDAARNALKNIPVEHHNRIARFLEAQDLKEMALEVSTDPEHKFELAMQCKKLKLAHDILLESESEQKWKQLGDAALNLDFDLKLAEECYTRSHDLGGLLLLYTSMGDVQGIEKLIKLAQSSGHHNVAFVGLFLLHRVEDCVQLLCSTDRIPEAAFLTRTYLPSHISRILALWKTNLAQVSVKAAEALADPHDYEEKFPDLKWGVKAEEWVAANKRTLHPATDYAKLRAELSRNYIQELKDGLIQEVRAGDKPKPVSTPAAAPAAATVTPTPAPVKPVTATPTPTPAPATSAAPFTHPAQAVTPAAASALAAAAKPNPTSTPAPAITTPAPAVTPIKPVTATPTPTPPPAAVPAVQTPAPWPQAPAATAVLKPAAAVSTPALAPVPATVPKAAESKAPEPVKPAAAPAPAPAPAQAPAKSTDPLDDFDDFGDDLDEVDPFADIAPVKPAAATPAKPAILPTKPAETKAPEPGKPAATAPAPAPAKPAATAPSFDDFGMDDDDASVSVPSIDDINRKLQALDNSDDDEI